MPQWEEELQTLLASLGVTIDAPASSDAAASMPTPFLADESQEYLDEGAAPGNPDDRLTLVQSEVEATMREVARLAREGSLDPAVHQDILYVLRSLTRSSPIAGHEGDEWDLASAAAVLHFCRIVSRFLAAISQRHPQ